jgi:hypothetical protein
MVQGKRIPLDAQQYGELVQLSGQPAKQALTQALKSPEWKAMGDEDRRQFVKDYAGELSGYCSRGAIEPPP